MFSAKILFFLTTSTFFLQCMSEAKQVHLRGTPEVDYPTYYAIPKTSFRCSDQLYSPGLYADTETRCQVFHYCYEHRQESFLCPMGTVFNQPILTCDYWYSSNCSLAPSYYNVNSLKKDQYLFDEADDPLDSQSENLFDKMADLYEMDKTPESPVLNDSVTTENELLSKEADESSSDPFAEKNNKAENYNKYSYDKQLNMTDEKQPEIVKYNIIGLNAVNVHKDSKNEQPYETNNMKDFIFSEDGMLHPSQEDSYQMPTDMNFDQGYSGYAEIPSQGNFNYDLNESFDFESDFQIPDFELQKRHSDMNGNNVRRRPSSRKPIIIIPEVEPELVQLPVTKRKRKPIGIAATVSTNADEGSSYETTHDPNIYNEETISVANEGLEGTASGEFPLGEPISNINNKFNDPKLYESPEEIEDENGSQLYQIDSSNVIYDYSNKKEIRKAYVLSNVDEDEISSNVFGSGSNDLLSISNIKHRTLTDSNYDNEAEIFTENSEGSIILPGESSDTTIDNESSSDSDAFLGSGSEENIIQPHISDGSSFFEDQDIFSDTEDTENTDMETSYELPMNLSNTFEGSGISVQKTANMPNFAEEVSDPTQFVLKYDSEGHFEYGREANFPSGTFGNLSPLESSENNEEAELLPDGSGGSSELNYLPHEWQESSDNPQDGFDKMVPEIRDIDGAYYVFSDSEYSNDGYDDPSGFYSENVNYADAEHFEDISVKAPEELIYSEEFQYIPEGSNLKKDYMEEETLHTLDYQDSRHLENSYEKLSDEFETETSSDIPEEEYTVDDTAMQFSTEDLKFLEVMSQTPIPMLKNLFEVSEKSSSGAIEDEIPRTEIISLDQHVIHQNHGDPASLDEIHESESLFSDVSSDAAENYDDMESSNIHPEILGEQKIAEEASDTDGADPASLEEVHEFESLSSDAEENSVDMESSDIHSEILGTEQKIAEEASDTVGSNQNETDVFVPEQNLEVFVPGKEADPFGPLFADGNEILDGPKSKQKLSLKAPLLKPKNALMSPVMSKDLKKVARGKRLSENLQTFNPPKKGNPLMAPRKETFREAMFTRIPSDFLKMKHSTLRPYFYNYGLKNYGFNPRAGDMFESSKLSKLTSFGKRLLAAKSAKFNIMKKYIDSYRNN